MGEAARETCPGTAMAASSLRSICSDVPVYSLLSLLFFFSSFLLFFFSSFPLSAYFVWRNSTYQLKGFRGWLQGRSCDRLCTDLRAC
jgi:hypothetical protein